MSTIDLADLEQAREALEDARQHLHASIARAYQDGASLRAIADAVGCSHETVRTVVRLATDEAAS